jgi:broad specificity phosphatase PhoE
MGIDVYVMRHGETEANVHQILMGREDSPFTSAGWRHPVEVAEHLKGRDLGCVYSSPMERTQRTARLVLETLERAIPLKTEEALAELDAGEYTGLSFGEVRARVPSDAVLGEFRYPGGESWGEVQARAVAFVAGLSGDGAGASVLLVTHAGVIAGLVAAYVGDPIERYIRTRFGHDFLGLLKVEAGEITGYEKLAGTVDTWF